MGVFAALPPGEKTLVAIGVLLDGERAASFLATNKGRGEALSAAAAELARLSPELRLPYAGSVIRRCLEESE
jgi:hypothetical protein